MDQDYLSIKTEGPTIPKDGKNRLERKEMVDELIARETLGFNLFSVLTAVQRKQVEIAIKYA